MLTKNEAKKILDHIREGYGHAYSEACTIECLHLTGDLDVHGPVRSERVDTSVQGQGYYDRRRESAIMVGRSKA